MSITKHFTLLILALIAVVFVSPARSQALKADEVVSKHLDSIGPADKRAALTTIMALGYSEFEAKNPQVKGGGKAVVVSDPENLFFIISLNSKEY
ncbi:MAG TPA: hypothetical protein VNA17_07330, partial [Pyrinomonadaceae bacterium]|nr:hypothetical protein [Pyrinomonadaceae bacterium]